MDWAISARDAYTAIGKAYEESRRRPILVADLAVFGPKALDIGSGRGAQPAYLEAEHPYVVHCDLSPELIPQGSEAVLCEATMLPFRSGAFDVVYAVAVFHHLPPDALARAVAEGLRVGRRLVATTWLLPGGGGERREIAWRWRSRAVRIYYVYGLSDLASAVSAAGGRPLMLTYLRRGRRLNSLVLAERIGPLNAQGQKKK